jgi:predicted secreted protein
MLKITFVLLLGFATQAFGNQHNKIDTLGMSKAGQFVALEEYGYKPNSHSYFVTIKIINVWTKEYVGSTIKVEAPAFKSQNLNQARLKAKKLASEDLKRFKILG